MQQLLKKIRRTLNDKKNRRQASRVVSSLCCVIVFVTTYAMVLPAITMEQQAQCGIEAHQHYDSCYELQPVCGLEESADHAHTDACYEKVLICGKEAHVHSKACYTDAGKEMLEEVFTAAQDMEQVSAEEAMGAAGGSSETQTADTPAVDSGNSQSAGADSAISGAQGTDPAFSDAQGADPAFSDVQGTDAAAEGAQGASNSGTASPSSEETAEGTNSDPAGNSAAGDFDEFAPVQPGQADSATDINGNTGEYASEDKSGEAGATDAADTAEISAPAQDAGAGTDAAAEDTNMTEGQEAAAMSEDMPALIFEDTILIQTATATAKQADAETATDAQTGAEKQTDAQSQAGTESQTDAGISPARDLLPAETNVTVHVEAEEGTFPAGTSMVLATVQEEALDKVAEAVSNSVEGTSHSFQAVDISFRDASGNEIEPAKPVRVTMTSDAIKTASETPEIAEPVVLHMVNEGEAEDAKDISLQEDSVQFEGESFSIYAVVYTLEYVIETESGIYKVTVTYGPDAKIPEGAALEVTEFSKDSEEYTAAREAVINEKRTRGESFVDSELELAALDISIMDNTGNEIEPQSPVAVRLEMKELPEDADIESLASTMEVQHIVQTVEGARVDLVAAGGQGNLGNVAVTDQNAVVTFTADSFSTYTITWGGGLIGKGVSRISSGQYIICARDAANGKYYALVPGRNSNGTLSTVEVSYDNGIVTYSGSQNLYWNVNVGSGEAPYSFSFGSGYNTYYLRAGYDHVTSTRDTRYYGSQDATYFGQYSDHLHSAGNTFLRCYNGVFQFINDVSEGWENRSNVFFVKSTDVKSVKVHYGYMDGNTFREFDELPAGAQESYDGPEFIGDQLNLRYDITGKDFVTVRINDPRSGVQISPLLQTEASNAGYWRYRKLDDKTINAGINEWQEFGNGENDLYVIYRDTPTMTSTGVDLSDPTNADLGAPQTDKTAHANGDGTYDIALSVTGSSKSHEEKTHANVVIVLDTSSSMFNADSYDTGESGKNRLAVAKEALNNLAGKLFAYNTKEDPNAIEVAMVDFAHRVRNETTMHTIYGGYGETNLKKLTDMVSAIPEYSGYGGTNYDTAIEAANSILWNDADPVYIVFITDGDTVSRGYLPYDESGNTFPADWDGGTYYNASDRDGKDHLARARSAAALQVKKAIDSGKQFYSIGVFGTVAYLEQMGGTYLGQANERSKIDAAFDKILTDIEKKLGYQDVTLTDGITDLSSTTMVPGTMDSFSYTVTDDLGNRAVVRVNQKGEVFGLAVNPKDPENPSVEAEVTDVTQIETQATVNVIVSGNSGDAGTAAEVTGNLSYTVEDAINDGAAVKDANEVAVKKITITVKDNNGKTLFEAQTATASYSEDSKNSKTGHKAVEWNLGPVGILKDKWKYGVEFTVWPKQRAYDILADLNNGLMFYYYEAYLSSLGDGDTPLTEEEAVADGIVLAETEREQIIHNGTGYAVKTNTWAGVSYRTVKSQTGSEDIVSDLKTGEITDPKQTMGLDESKVDIEKKWDVSLAPEQLTRFLTENPEYEVDLHIVNNSDQSFIPVKIKPVLTYESDGTTVKSATWPKATAYIAPGVMLSEEHAKEKGVNTDQYPCLTYKGVKYYLLETGHNYTMEEFGSDWHFELESEVYHPMVVDGVEREVSFTFTGNQISEITAIDTDNQASLTATNKLRSGLNIIKKVYDANNNLLSSDDSTFYVKLTLKDKDGKEIKYEDYLLEKDYQVGTIEHKEYVEGHYWLIKAKTGDRTYTYYSLNEDGSRQVDQNAYPIWYNDYAKYVEDSETGRVDGVGNWTLDSIWESGEVKEIKQGQLLQLKNIPYGTQVILTEVSPIRNEDGKITGYTDIETGETANGYKLLGIDGEDGNGITADFNKSYKIVVNNQRLVQEIYFRKADIAYRDVTDEAEFKTLDGAEFVLYKDSAKLYFDKNHKVMTQAEVEAAIEMSVNETGAKDAMRVAEISDSFAFCDEGQMLKVGIMDGTFRLKEIKAPDGYIILENEIEFKVEGTNVTESSDYMDFRKVEQKPVVTVYNEPGAELPATGGPGTTLLYLLGIMLTGLAGAGLVMKRLRRNVA